MYIEKLELNNFRNYPSLSMELDPGTNLLFGDNAQGKTNILESVILCGTTKSHRGSKDKEMIRFETPEAHIRLYIKKKNMPYRIDMHLKRNKAKGIAINGIPIKKASELFGISHMVLFSPEDLNIIKNGPSERRKFIDMELCQLNNLYLSRLSSYNHVLNQRNKLLKDIYFMPELADTLDVWDEQLVSYGETIIKERIAFIEELNELIKTIHKNLTGEKETIDLVYENDVHVDEFHEQIRESRSKDLKLKATSRGPHRDDIGIKVNGIDIRKYGSQGQQRTVALSLKLSEIYLVEKKIKDTPILLLDDVLSELDSGRQNYLLGSIHNIQTLITCTGLDDFVKSQFKIDKLFHVENGNVELFHHKGGNE